ncbi:MAG: hypothetical protein J5864_04980, partial [Oscillospiraceae bacterium]|nr:hypothetical protein [Oscillospiraceae bacterium]
MKKHVRFSFESNVISCGVRLKPNFLKSVDVINGAVLRAAFANDILLECPFAEELTDGKKYQVVSRGEKCDGCKNKNICEKFSEMKFSFMYPENTLPAPFTSRTCKAGGTDHAVMDTVMENGALACPVCKGRMESLKGLIDSKSCSSVHVPHSSSTHTAIDPNTRTALEGSLFSIDAIKRGMIYECEIDDCDTGMISEGKVIYLGKYSSNGFGKIKIISVTEAEKSDVKARVAKFNEKFRTAEDGKMYASVLFLSDAKLDIDKYADGIRTTEEYRNIWKEAVFGKESCISVEQVTAQNYTYNG